ncbi:MAG: ribonuclease E/G, partial [Pseudomonadota bacterium]
MPKTMLIDAYHREETRVAVLQGGKVEDFDFEYASRKPLRGNIYLARVTRVEPSLQAAFVEYGGNRHGFLAFGEIHPDYYQIPVADREVLRKAEALEVELAQKLADLSNDDHDDIDPDEDELRASADDNEAAAEAAGADTSSGDEPDADTDEAEASAETEETPAEEPTAPDYAPMTEEQDVGGWHGADADLMTTVSISEDEAKREEEEEEEELLAEPTAEDEADAATDDVEAEAEPEPKLAKMFYPEVDKKAEEDAAAKAAQAEINKLRARYEEAKRDRNRLLRAYKIQEVIKRRQIMLVQVVKEERGNKGAALTTYLSLAGRYGVLMPNTARGGGISRK